MTITCTDLGFVTGEQSKNRTDQRWAVGGTDLGLMWDTGRGEVGVLFGDTWCPRNPAGGAGGEDWRHQVLAFSRQADLSEGLVLDRFVTDREGHAAQLIPDNEFPGFAEEITTIPTGVCRVGRRQYMAYMSVQRWGDPGEWVTNYAGLAHSSDGGETWTKSESAWWPNTPCGDQKFQVCTLVTGRQHVYLFGTRNGRRGPAFLARAPHDRVLDLDSHEQWSGWGWVKDQERAAPVMDGEVAEISVGFHWPSRLWLALHMIDRERRLVVRAAPTLVGPWSPPETVATEAQFITLYGGFWHPWSLRQKEPVAVISQWSEYNTRAVRVGLGL